MKRTERSMMERTIDDVVSVAMALANKMRTGEPSEALKAKFLRVTRKLEKATGKR